MKQEKDPRGSFSQQDRNAPEAKQTEAEAIQTAREAFKKTGSKSLFNQKEKAVENDSRKAKPL